MEETTSHKQKRKKGKISIVLIIIGAIVVIGLIGIIIFQKIKMDSGNNPEEVARKVQEKVAKIMLLPDEDALVSDIENAAEIRRPAIF